MFVFDPAVVQAQARGEFHRQVSVEWQAQGVAPYRANGTGTTVFAVAAHSRVIGNQQLFDGGQCIRAVLHRQLALPLPRLRCPLAVAPLGEVGAVLLKLRLGPVFLHLVGIPVGAEPGQALGVVDVQVPHRAVEPEQVQARFGHGERGALDVQVYLLQVAVDVFVGQLQVGAQLVALVAPQHAVAAQADLIGAATVVKRGAAELERRAVFGMAGEQAVGPVTVGDRVEQAVAAAVARPMVERVAEAQVERVVDLQRAVQAQVDGIAITPGASAAKVIHPQAQGPARGTAARAQDDARRARRAAWGDVGGKVHRAQAIELVQALFQVS